jgi:hypothetical protein
MPRSLAVWLPHSAARMIPPGLVRCVGNRRLPSFADEANEVGDVFGRRLCFIGWAKGASHLPMRLRELSSR